MFTYFFASFLYNRKQNEKEFGTFNLVKINTDHIR